MSYENDHADHWQYAEVSRSFPRKPPINGNSLSIAPFSIMYILFETIYDWKERDPAENELNVVPGPLFGIGFASETLTHNGYTALAVERLRHHPVVEIFT